MTLANSGFAAVRLSSEDFPVRDRVEATCEIYGRAIFKLDVEPLPDSAFHVDMTLRATPGLGVATGKTSRVRCRHTSELIDSDDLIRVVALSGGVIAEQRGREATIKNQEATLITGAETSVITFHSDSRFMNLRLPFRAISPLVADLSAALMRPVPQDVQALKLLLNYAGVLQSMNELATSELRHLATTHIHDLVALTLGATRDAAETATGRGVRAARLRAIKAYIIENIGRRDLLAEEVATRHQLSERYFRKLFEAGGLSFSDFVLSQRLARAYRLLTDPRFANRTVSVIAFDVGFSDLSYFNRAFRRRYGMTPSDVREAARRDNNT